MHVYRAISSIFKVIVNESAVQKNLMINSSKLKLLQAVGGYPAPMLQWFLNTTQLDQSTRQVQYLSI